MEEILYPHLHDGEKLNEDEKKQLEELREKYAEIEAIFMADDCKERKELDSHFTVPRLDNIQVVVCVGLAYIRPPSRKSDPPRNIDPQLMQLKCLQHLVHKCHERHKYAVPPRPITYVYDPNFDAVTRQLIRRVLHPHHTPFDVRIESARFDANKIMGKTTLWYTPGLSADGIPANFEIHNAYMMYTNQAALERTDKSNKAFIDQVEREYDTLIPPRQPPPGPANARSVMNYAFHNLGLYVRKDHK